MGLGINIGGGLSGAGTGAAIGSAIPGIGTADGAIVGGALGLFSGNSGLSYKDNKKLMDQSWEYEKEAMELQYGYNERMAQSNQERNLDLWNKTNFEAQREHLENDTCGNYVSEGTVESERILLEKGFSPKEARELSTVRVFGGAGYGTGITGLVILS